MRLLKSGLIICGGVGGFLTAVAMAAPAKSEPELPLARLVELNAEALFGGTVKVDNDRFTMTFPGGRFGKGFVCRHGKTAGVYSKNGELRRQPLGGKLLGGIDKIEEKFSFAGLIAGETVSRFQLADDFKLSFKLRVPQFERDSSLTWFINRESNKSYLGVDFFREISVIDKAKKRRETSADQRFRGSPLRWFDSKSTGVPVEIVFKDGKMTVCMETRVAEKKEADIKEQQGNKPAKEKEKEKEKEIEKEMAEVIALDGVDEPRHGHLAIRFTNLSFVVSEFQIEGRLPEEWIQRRFDQLRKARRLKVKEPPAEKKEPEKKPDEKKETPKKNKIKKDKKKGPDLDKPDPEADEDL